MSTDTGHISSQLQVLSNSGDACVISNKSLITHVKSSVQPRKDALEQRKPRHAALTWDCITHVLLFYSQSMPVCAVPTHTNLTGSNGLTCSSTP